MRRLLRRRSCRAPWLVAVALLGGMTFSACAGLSPGASAPEASAPFVDPPRREGKPLVLIAMPSSPAFLTVRSTLVAELRKDFDIETYLVDARTTAATFTAHIEQALPACVVLMDNPTVKLYSDYQRVRSVPGLPIPAIIVMSSFLEELRAHVPNAGGVAYEVQSVSAFVTMRSIVQGPVTRVGVLHRPGFQGFIERQKVLADREKIVLVPREVPTNPTPADIKAGLRALRVTGHVDALWVLNDNRLLQSAEFIESGWRSELDALAVPVVVGTQSLASRDARFGTLAVVPDLEALGVQAANLVFDAADNGWRVDWLPVDLPVSIVTVVNMREIREKFGLREKASQRIDIAIE